MRTLPWIDIAVITILGLYALSGANAFGHVPFHEAMKLIPYALIYFLVKILCLSDTRSKWSLPFIVSIICCAGLYESVIGILQVLGVRQSNNSLFPITGTLNNPGPYGGLVAVVLSTTVGAYHEFRKETTIIYKAVRVLCLVTTVLCMMVLPASMSRAGWLAAAVSAIIMAVRNGWVQRFLAGPAWKCVAVATLAALLSASTFMMKKESALGRMHMWTIECRAISARPLTGYGPGRLSGAYGEAQADYFKRGNRPKIRMRLAGSPEYAFNEYLRVGVEAGVPAMTLAILAVIYSIVTLLRRNNPVGYGLLALSVFAAFSYPLSSPVHCCVLVSMLASASASLGTPAGRRPAIVNSSLGFILASSAAALLYMPYSRKTKEAEQEWITSQGWLQMRRYDLVVNDAAILYPALKDDYRFLYDYGRALFESGQYEKSISILQEGTLLSSDPAFHLMTGRNQEALGRRELAKEEYLHAHYMTPGRLYPLRLLMACQLADGDTASAVITARKALGIPVNEKNLTMHNLHSEIESDLHSLCHEEQ